MDDNKIILYSNNKIEISESQDDSYMNVKFIICNFEPNKNNVMLNRDTIENWLNTLIMKPLVGLIKPNKDDELDFTSHQAKKVYELINGQLQEKLKFGTDAFGVFDSVQIETIDNVEYITANCRVWRRFENCCKIIQERFDNNEPLNTSWEISIENSSLEDFNGIQIKVINDGVFIGHALLSKYTSPAYDCSGMLEVAEEQNESDLAQAFIDDLTQINQVDNVSTENELIEEIQTNNSEIENQETEISIQSEDNSVENKLKENIEEKGGIVDMAEKIEKSSVNTEDLEGKVRGAIYATETMGRSYWGVIVYPYDYVAYAKLDMPSSTREDFTKFTFIVNSDDTISLTSQEDVKMTFTPMTQNQEEMVQLQTQIDCLNDELSTKNTELSTKLDEIVTLGESITSLKDQLAEKDTLIAELEPLRIEKAEAEAKKAEEEKAEKKKCLSEMLVSSKYFTQEEIEVSENIKEAIASLDEDSVKKILAERVIAEAQKIKEEPKEAVVSETKEKEVEVSTDLSTNYEYETSSNALLSYARRNIKK